MNKNNNIKLQRKILPVSDIHVKQSLFFPINPLDNKNNYKRVFRIEKDGTIIEKVFLDVPDSSNRELLICLHYIRHISRHFLKKNIGVNIISRDSPWDFKLELSTGMIFNVEITSIADTAQHFAINKKEERLKKWSISETIPYHELKKLSKLFPNQCTNDLINQYKMAKISDNEKVDNPFIDKQYRLILSNLCETKDTLDSLIHTAITKKINKKHDEKEKTILIIDNRTSAFDIPDYLSTTKVIEPLIEQAPFPEIWFYTGYYSDDDGSNAEFSFAPLKVTKAQKKILNKLNTDKNCRVIW